MVSDKLLLLFHGPLFLISSYGFATFFHIFKSTGAFQSSDPILMLCFLTVWGQIFLTIFFLTSTLVDIFNIFKVKKNTSQYYLILKSRDVIFRSIVFPIGSVVTTLFWSIYYVDRELILSKALDEIYPWYLNHLQHTLPGLLVLFETLLVNHQYHASPISIAQIKQGKTPPHEITPFTSNLKQDIAHLVTFILFYLGIIAFSRFHLGFWVYPVLAVIPVHSKIIFIFSSSCFGVALYIIGRGINQKMWGGESVFVVPISRKSNLQPSTKKLK